MHSLSAVDIPAEEQKKKETKKKKKILSEPPSKLSPDWHELNSVTYSFLPNIRALIN